jgi:hypothetical protein
MTARLTAATAALVLALAAPAAAAITVESLNACYASAGAGETQREGVDVVARGFAPASPVEVLVDGIKVSEGFADSVGVVRDVTVLAPYVERGERPFTVVVRHKLSTGTFGSAASRVTNLAVTLKPNRARPSRRVAFRGRGFMADAPVWAHYVFGGKARKTVRLVRRPTGSCGVFTVRRKQIPIERPRTGEWTVQIDQSRQFVEEAPGTNWVQVLIEVARAFRDPGDGERNR